MVEGLGNNTRPQPVGFKNTKDQGFFLNYFLKIIISK
jgi:hypothetical protein